ncbi:MAG TPA: hypothetical protein VGB45_07555 [Abditibacterium sp.]|jgi:hypothetical protein
MAKFLKIVGPAAVVLPFGLPAYAQEITPIYDVPRVENIVVDGLDSDWQTRLNPQLYEWFLQHRRSDRK